MKTSKVTVTGIIINDFHLSANNRIIYNVGDKPREIERLFGKEGNLMSLRDTILKYENTLEFEKAFESDEKMTYYNSVTVLAISCFDGVYRAELALLNK